VPELLSRTGAANVGRRLRHPHRRACAMSAWGRCLSAIVRREALRFVHQRGRFLSALVRPLVWLAIFAAASASCSASRSRTRTRPTCSTRPTSSRLVAMVAVPACRVALHGLGRETGSMRVLLTSRCRAGGLLFSKLLEGRAGGVCRPMCSLASPALGGRAPRAGYLAVLPALLLSGMMLGRSAVLSSWIRQLGEFRRRHELRDLPDVLSPPPLILPAWRVKEASLALWWACQLNRSPMRWSDPLRCICGSSRWPSQCRLCLGSASVACRARLRPPARHDDARVANAERAACPSPRHSCPRLRHDSASPRRQQGHVATWPRAHSAWSRWCWQ
jgi:ABC-2 type transport system permease protein